MDRWTAEQATHAALIVLAKVTFEEALQLLGLSRDQLGDKAAVKKAYRDAAMRHHPDRGGDEETMKKVTDAYDLLKGARGRPSPSDREAEKRETEEKLETIKHGIHASLKIEAFTDHFTKWTGKNFEVTVDEGSHGRTYSSRYTVNIQWVSEDELTTFDLEIGGSVSNFRRVRQLGGGGGDQISFEIYTNTKIFHETRKAKFKQRDWDFTDKHITIMDPEKLFPSKKIVSMIKGKEKKRKFSRRDMFLGIEKRLKGESDQKEWAYIPMGEATLVMHRSTIMRHSAWSPFSLQEGKEKTKIRPVSGPESEELLVALIDIQKKAKTMGRDRLATLIYDTFKDVQKKVWGTE